MVSLVPCYPHLASLYIASSPSCVSKLSYSASVAVFSTVDVDFAFLYFLACCLLLWFRLLPLFEHSFYWPLSPSASGCSSRYPVFASKLAHVGNHIPDALLFRVSDTPSLRRFPIHSDLLGWLPLSSGFKKTLSIQALHYLPCC